MAKDSPLTDLIFSKSFSERLEEAANVLKDTDCLVRVITHYDPDGMTSAAILCKTLSRLGRQYQATLVSKLDDDFIESIMEEDFDLLILADMGSGKVEKLMTSEKPVIVLDHHTPQAEGGEPVIHINPHLFGIDGAREISGSTTTFALAITVDEENWDLATLALTGAVGDRQNIGGFRGFNDVFAAVAQERQLVKIERVIDLRGETISDSLALHPEPYFAGLSGRKREINKFLKDLGIDKESKLKDLREEQSRRLNSALALRLLKQGATSEAIDQVVPERYWLYDWGMYADELVSILNSCGRRKEYGIGLSAALGSKESLELAVEIRDKHRAWILKKMQEMEDEKIEKKKNIQYFHIKESNYTGVIGGLCTLYIFDKSKPTFGLSQEDGSTGISARAPRALVEQGLDLGLACRTASEKAGGTGGGHDIAAGAKVPIDNEDKFLKEMDKVVGEQLAA